MTCDGAEFDVCWHCHVCLVPEPMHCDQCPPPGECDLVGCTEPGCCGEAPAPSRLDRCLDLLRRVIDDGNDEPALRGLAHDIAVELGVPDPFAQN
jgi:hypothetical protein